MSDDLRQRAIEQWFRRRGLPTVVRGRPDQLLVRIIPALVPLTLWRLLDDLLQHIDGDSDAEFDRRMADGWFALGYSLTLVGLVVLPVAGAWLAARWAHRRTVDLKGAVPAAVATGLYVLLWPVLDIGSLPQEVLVGVLTVLALVGLAGLGVDSVLGWALRAALRQIRSLGTMTSKALPLLLLFTTFGFLTTEVWQVAGSLQRRQLWSVVGLFLVVGLLYMLSALSEELRALASSRREPAAQGWWQATPFDAPDPDDERVPLRRREKANMVLVLMLAQSFQVLVFSVLMFAFFVVFGIIAVPHDVMTQWIGHAPKPGSLFGIQLPVPDELLQVSMFLAAFSGLYFVSSTVTDARYRASFLDPLVDHVAVSLAAREIYLRSPAR